MTAKIVYYFATEGFKLNLDIVNFTFLFLGVLLQRTPINYVRAASEGAKACSGIIVQFPLYAGIMGMMSKSGLVVIIAGWFVAVSNGWTYSDPHLPERRVCESFCPLRRRAVLAVQGPIMVEAAKTLTPFHSEDRHGCGLWRSVDEHAPTFRPWRSWSHPLKAREIVGYTMVVMILTGIVICLGVAFLPA